MFKNLNVPLLDMDGKPALSQGKPATIRQFILEALMSTPNDDRSTGEQKFQRFRLATKVSSDEISVDLTPEEIVTIKDFVGKIYGPLVVGQVYDLLNNDAKAQNIELPKAQSAA